MSAIRNFINIVNENTSSYEGRVQEVVDKVIQYHKNDPLIGKEQILSAIRSAARDVSDYKMGGRTQKEFISDVLAGLKGNLATPKVDRKSENQKKLQQIAVIINDAIGNTIPDGDPFDEIMVKMARLGYNANQMDIMPMLDKAAKLNGFNSYHSQVVETWDDYVGTENNPWR